MLGNNNTRAQKGISQHVVLLGSVRLQRGFQSLSKPSVLIFHMTIYFISYFNLNCYYYSQIIFIHFNLTQLTI